MMMALSGYIQGRKITQTRAARIMRVSQPRISDLILGKIGLFIIDTLVNVVTAAGLTVEFGNCRASYAFTRAAALLYQKYGTPTSVPAQKPTFYLSVCPAVLIPSEPPGMEAA